MKKQLNILLLMSLCLSATAHVVSTNGTTMNCMDLNFYTDTIKSTSQDKHQPMTESAVKLDEVVVTSFVGNQKVKQSPAPVSIISARQLEAQPSSNLIDAIARQPGISQVTTGSGISKPVIRGLGYNRVLIVNDGVRQEGQQWGDEHGVEIDQHTVHSAEIIKGPASLRYGSDAMAGVIVFRSAPVLLDGEMKANATAGYQTNNGLWDYSINWQGNRRGFVWNTLYSGKFAHDYKNHYDGYVNGSRYKEQSLTQMLGFNRRWGYSHLSLSYYHLTPGIVEGEEVGNRSYDNSVPFQQIHHYKAVLDNSFRLGEGALKATVGYQLNRRQEFEETPDDCGLHLVLQTATYDVHYDWDEAHGWQF